MVEVRNLLFQPVSLHLAGDGRGFHMGPRERVQIRDDQVSLEMQMAARRGQIALVPVEDVEAKPVPEPAAPQPLEKREPARTSMDGFRGRRGRDKRGMEGEAH
jgi:hypothetical protein